MAKRQKAKDEHKHILIVLLAVFSAIAILIWIKPTVTNLASFNVSAEVINYTPPIEPPSTGSPGGGGGGGGKKTEITSPEVFFDLLTTIPQEYKSVIVGEAVLVYIEMKNLGQRKLVDLQLEYYIKRGQKIFSRTTETIGVDTTKRIERAIKIEEGMEPGEYEFYAELSYQNWTVRSSSSFIVTAKEWAEEEPRPEEQKPLGVVIPIAYTLLLIIAIFVIIIGGIALYVTLKIKMRAIKRKYGD